MRADPYATPSRASMGRTAAVVVTLVALAGAPASVPAQQTEMLEHEVAAWWATGTADARAEQAERILRLDAPWTALYSALETPRPFSDDAPRGRVERSRTNRDGFVHRYLVRVPESYDPARSWPVRFYLHGGISRPDPGSGGGWVRNLDRLSDDDHLLVAPLSWSESPWWQERQVENLRGILDEVRATWNVDPNRVHALGVSDGGTGVYFLAFRDPTPWSGFLPFIGSPSVLLNPGVAADGRMHPGNLKNRPLFIVNGERDRLYPTASVRPWIEAFEALGVEHDFRPQPGGHDLDFWPSEAGAIKAFVERTIRDPHPDQLVWGTESPDQYPRVHWLAIDEVGDVQGDDERWALASWAADTESGMMRATRAGNHVQIDAYRVRRFRLLVSPEEFDLSQPVRVEVNGTVLFDQRVEPSSETLLKWAGIDRDESMLYVAEIEVTQGR